MINIFSYYTYNNEWLDSILSYDSPSKVWTTFSIMFFFNLVCSSYPIYFWNKSASMLGGVTGPYLVYLKERDSPRPVLTPLRILAGVGAAVGYLAAVLLSVAVAKRFGKTSAGILMTNIVVFVTMVMIAFGVAFLLE